MIHSMRLTSATLLTSVCLAALGGTKPVVEDKVKDRFVPIPYESQTMGGYLGERMRVNLEQRLLRVDEAGVLAGFQERPGVQDWIGEHMGKYLDAAVNTYELTKDARLKTQMDRMVNAWLPTQLADGYLGTYVEAKRWTSWDVWVHKYDLIGLLAYYRLTGDERALAAARKVGNLLTATFGEGKRDIIASSTHVGMAATSVLEPICQLYRYTGDKRYLDFAEYIVKSWEQPNGPKLVSSLTTHGNVYKTANAKAYEMMSDLVGLLELYRLTGKTEYLTTASNAWADIRAKRQYITGTTSSHEHFQDDFVLPGQPSHDVGEGCATVTWLQLTSSLLRLTGEAKYGQALEQTVYNQLLGAQDARTGYICYFTPLNGRKSPRSDINCCQSSEPRGISMIPQLAWGSLNGGVAIELFNEGEIHAVAGGVKVKIAVTGRFPESGDVGIIVTPEKTAKFPLMVRVPAWTDRAIVRVGGKSINGKPGEYLRLDGPWKPGTEVKVAFEMSVRAVDGGKSYPGFEAIQRGPQVLALERGLNDAVPYLHLAAPKSVPARLELVNGAYEVEGVAAVPESKQRRDVRLRLVPFADAQEYRVWMAKPGSLTMEIPAVTAFGRETSSSRSDQADGSICDERVDTWRRTRDGRSGDEAFWAVEIPAAKRVSRVVFRAGEVTDDGGWFLEKPRVEIKRAAGESWEAVGVLEAYPAGAKRPSITTGQAFEFRLPQTAEVVGVRVVGKNARKFTSCAELGGYE